MSEEFFHRCLAFGQCQTTTTLNAQKNVKKLVWCKLICGDQTLEILSLYSYTVKTSVEIRVEESQYITQTFRNLSLLAVISAAGAVTH